VCQRCSPLPPCRPYITHALKTDKRSKLEIVKRRARAGGGGEGGGYWDKAHDRTVLLSSSVSPNAQNTASSLGERLPLYRLDVPSSPVLVYTLKLCVATTHTTRVNHSAWRAQPVAYIGLFKP
jgi:hypothetical protein